MSELFNKAVSDAPTLTKMLDDVGTRSNALKLNIQVLLSSCILHAMEHGDVTFINKACRALDTGWRTNAVKGFFEAHGPVVWSAEDSIFKHSKVKMAKLKTIYEENKLSFASKLMADDWTKFKPEVAFEGYSLTGKIIGLINKAKKDLADQEKAGKIRDTEEIAKLESVMAQFTVSKAS